MNTMQYSCDGRVLQFAVAPAVADAVVLDLDNDAADLPDGMRQPLLTSTREAFSYSHICVPPTLILGPLGAPPGGSLIAAILFAPCSPLGFLKWARTLLTALNHQACIRSSLEEEVGTAKKAKNGIRHL